ASNVVASKAARTFVSCMFGEVPCGLTSAGKWELHQVLPASCRRSPYAAARAQGSVGRAAARISPFLVGRDAVLRARRLLWRPLNAACGLLWAYISSSPPLRPLAFLRQPALGLLGLAFGLQALALGLMRFLMTSAHNPSASHAVCVPRCFSPPE